MSPSGSTHRSAAIPDFRRTNGIGAFRADNGSRRCLGTSLPLHWKKHHCVAIFELVVESRCFQVYSPWHLHSSHDFVWQHQRYHTQSFIAPAHSSKANSFFSKNIQPSTLSKWFPPSLSPFCPSSDSAWQLLCPPSKYYKHTLEVYPPH